MSMVGRSRRMLADWFVAKGNVAADAERGGEARAAYERAIRADPSWSVPWYNLGLAAKYAGGWEESARCNARAVALAPDDEAAWWNLGIASTALRDWEQAHKAWQQVGIRMPGEDGEWPDFPATACVRLCPNTSGEVVWGERIDPARIVVLSVPLPETGHRFKDIVLHDGARNGARMLDGVEIPVFDALSLWAASDYRTFQVGMIVPDAAAEEALVALCHARDFGVEDWSTVRLICAACSTGNPGPHTCETAADGISKNTCAIAARDQNEVRELLEEWVRQSPGAGYKELKEV